MGLDMGLEAMQEILSSLTKKLSVNSNYSLEVAQNLETKIKIIERTVGAKRTDFNNSAEATTLWDAVATLFDSLQKGNEEEDSTSSTLAHEFSATKSDLLDKYLQLKRQLESLESGGGGFMSGDTHAEDMKVVLKNLVDMQSRLD